MKLVSPTDVMARLRAPQPGEWAFLDIRERGEAARGHPFGSTNVPFSTLELEIAHLVPRRATPLVLLDAGNGAGARAAKSLEDLGWREIALVEGGIPGWTAKGHPLVDGEHTFSKAFGEWVEHRFEVPEIGPDELAEAMEAPGPPLLIDGRPLPEHKSFTVPGSLNCPNADLGLRLFFESTPDRSIVMHCAGRTRSIIGAQTLRDFELADRVFAMRNGTQGWELSGRAREMGANRPVPRPSDAGRGVAIERARKVIATHAIPTVDAATVARWSRDKDRTTYFFDPRAEGEATPPPGFRAAPGTTLVQQTDRYIAVKGARVVLWDPDLVRAVFGALWLNRMGIEAHVLTEPPPPLGPVETVPPYQALPEIDAAEVADAIKKNGTVLDLRPAPLFRAGHIASARLARRSLIDLSGLPGGQPVVLIGHDADAASLVGADLRTEGRAVLGLNRDGPEEWERVGLLVKRGPPDEAIPDIEDVTFCAGRHRGNLDDARRYLAWETGLLDRLRADSLVPWPE